MLYQGPLATFSIVIELLLLALFVAWVVMVVREANLHPDPKKNKVLAWFYGFTLLLFGFYGPFLSLPLSPVRSIAYLKWGGFIVGYSILLCSCLLVWVYLFLLRPAFIKK